MVKESIKLSPFKLINQNGEIVKFPNKKVSILFFYPKANTPGCTAQACNLRDNYTGIINKFKTQRRNFGKSSR